MSSLFEISKNWFPKREKFDSLPRTKDPSCLFDPNIARLGWDGGLPIFSIKYCATHLKMANGGLIMVMQDLLLKWRTKKYQEHWPQCKNFWLVTSFGCLSMNFFAPWVCKEDKWCSKSFCIVDCTYYNYFNKHLPERKESSRRNPSLPSTSRLSARKSSISRWLRK